MINNPITSHILDTSSGKPAAGVPMTLYVFMDNQWQLLSSATTNEDGRVAAWESQSWYQDLQPEQLLGTYKIVFDLDVYWQAQEVPAFYPTAEISFRMQDTRHHHIPLLLSAYGYSTYRGS